jgi:hypothetical protein
MRKKKKGFFLSALTGRLEEKLNRVGIVGGLERERVVVAGTLENLRHRREVDAERQRT